jgi:flagellar hook-associated protein 1 FlgK
VSSGLIGVALTGLASAQTGIATTGHNIANVNTPGYARQQAVQTTNFSQATGAGWIGRGASVETIRRSYDVFLAAQARDARASAAHWESYAAQLGALDGAVADSDAGLGPALGGFFAAANALSSSPADAAARQALVSGAQSLAGRLRELDAAFAQQLADLDARLQSAVGSANALASRVAVLNERIALGGAAGHAPNDLLDQRDALVHELAGLVRVKVVAQDDGVYNLFLGNGQPLVVGAAPTAIVAVADRDDPQRTVLGLQTAAGPLRFRAGDLGGGLVGGLLAFREEALEPARNELGRIAVALAGAFNAQHALGIDRNGAPGGDFFAVGAPRAFAAAGNAGTAGIAAAISDAGALTASDYRVLWDGASWNVTRLADGSVRSFATLPQSVDGVSLSLASGVPAAGDNFLVQPTRQAAAGFAALVTSGALVAAAAPMRTAAASGNTGSGAVSAGAAESADPNLQQPVTITFTSAGSFDVTGAGTGNPAGVAFTPGAPIRYNGWRIEISGSPAAGDVFTITPNAGAAGDNRNALRLAALQSEALIEGASTLAQGYGEMLARLGNIGRQAQISAEAQARFLEESQARIGEVSGVNLDEEAASLLRYQQAYQAAAKLVAVAERLFDTILATKG